MGVKHRNFEYHQLENLTDDQLMRRFIREVRGGTYKNLPPQYTVFFGVCKSIVKARYNLKKPTLTERQRYCLINFQFMNDDNKYRRPKYYQKYHGTRRRGRGYDWNNVDDRDFDYCGYEYGDLC